MAKRKSKHRVEIAWKQRKGLTKWWATCSCEWDAWANEKHRAKALADDHEANPEEGA